jgi:predicted nucleic acid-binding protein
VLLPGAVEAELSHPGAPPTVRRWISSRPDWLEIITRQGVDPIGGLHKGEAAAIALAELLHADLLLIDDRDGVRAARQRGLRVTGTLGVLDIAAERKLLDFDQAIQELERTKFRRPHTLLEALLRKHKCDR